MCVCGRFTRCVKTILAGRLRVYGFTGSPQTSRSEGCELRSIEGLHPPISHLEYWEPAERSMVSNQAEMFFLFVSLFVCPIFKINKERKTLLLSLSERNWRRCRSQAESFLDPKRIYLVSEKPMESVWTEKDKLGRGPDRPIGFVTAGSAGAAAFLVARPLSEFQCL